MVMTQNTLLFVGVLSTLATLGLFVEYRDDWTGVLVGFAGAVMWAIFGVSAFRVTFPGTVTQEFTMMPLVMVGFGMAFITAIFALYDLFQAVGSEASAASDDLMPGP